MSGTFETAPVPNGKPGWDIGQYWDGTEAPIGAIEFSASDISSGNDPKVYGYLSVWNHKLIISHDQAGGVHDPSNAITLENGSVAIGDTFYNAKLSVDGPLFVAGPATAFYFEGSIAANDSTLFYDAETQIASAIEMVADRANFGAVSTYAVQFGTYTTTEIGRAHV